MKIYTVLHFELECGLNSKSVQPHLFEKATKFKERFYNILEKIDIFKSEDLLLLANGFLEEVYREFPDMVRLLDKYK